MPIYEFYCRPCNKIFSFFSRRINTDGKPDCPCCKRRLTREVSAFAAVGKRRSGEGAGDEAGGGLPFDESRMEKAIESLAQEAAGMNEEDPRQAAKLMRKLTDATGMKLGEGMEEAMRRLEAGEDPEAVEAELGDQFEKEDPFAAEGGNKSRGRKRAAPVRDKTLYEM